MPQSLCSVYLHATFSTKDRRPILKNESVRNDLYAYMGGICKHHDCAPIAIGGVEDHVHVLTRFGRKYSIADWIKELKRASSLFIKPAYPDFAWQNGYGVFGVGGNDVSRVVAYIQRQEEHHKKMSFQDELRALLRENDLEWDERYLWD